MLKLLKPKKTPFNKISTIKRSLLNQNDSIIVKTLLFGLNGLNGKENALIIKLTIKHIIITVMIPFKQITTSLEVSLSLYIYIHMVFTTEGFLEVALES